LKPSADNRPGRFVFQDPLGHRWPRLRRVLIVWCFLIGLVLVFFTWSVLVKPELRLPTGLRKLKGQLRNVTLMEEAPNDDKATEYVKFYELADAQDRLTEIRAATKKPRLPGNEVRLGFYVDWDPKSLTSFATHANSLTHVAPEWFSITETSGKLNYEPDPGFAEYAAKRGVAVVPLLDNLLGNTWQPEPVENLARGGAEPRRLFIQDLTSKLKEAKAAGVLIDWQQLDPSYTGAYTAFLTQLADALHKGRLELWLSIAPGAAYTTFDLAKLQLTVDRFVAILHDENSETDAPGPIASLPWIEGWLKVMSEFGEPGQWVGVLGAYAYDWNITTKTSETIAFKDAMSRASYAGVDQGPNPVTVVAPNYNGSYPYTAPDGEHRVFFLDAISFKNQLRALRNAKLGGVGIQRLGSEDPDVWEMLEMRGPLKPETVQALQPLLSDNTVTHVGRGEVVYVDDSKDDGKRQVTLDANGMLSARYVDFPTFPTLTHSGAGSAHQVSITFDDGPDPRWTPKVLDILRETNVKACFFMLGKNAEEYPRLVRRVIDEGHEIGNHTYSHQNLSRLSELRMKLELNMTQRVIESITGRSTALFRPPYNADSNPASVEELLPLKIAQDDLDYTVVLERIDPRDWDQPSATADVILQRVKDLRSEGSIVLLHDAGGNRAQTLAALPRIIAYLRERGDEIVPISTLLNQTHDDVMPLVTGRSQSMERMISGTGFQVWRSIIEFFWAFMIFATGLVVLRTLLVAWLARRHHRRVDGKVLPLHAPPVSIVIAAFNEGKVIAKTLRSLLQTDYPGELEVIVVDDGSPDNTADEVERMAVEDSRILLRRQANLGKAIALRNGVSHASHGVLVFLDADTLFERGTIRALTAPFINPLVGAVSGNARVGNPRNFITRCQSLEYICGFNLDRRAYTEWNCITVVPGAVSAYRRSAIDAAGGFSHDTLAEDTDLTLTLHRLHYRIEFAPDAIAWTEAPETLRSLAKQRFRWAFGTMQCLWKHRDLVLSSRHGALGWFSLPSIWFFQIGLVALTPFVDALLLYSIYSGTATAIWYYFVIFLAMELFLSALACRLEGEPIRRAWIAVPMRLVYRPLLAWVIWRSIFRALKGALVGWGKLERTASVPTRA
jgi:cellulose synthase/poly-beta-1,6-N-acetylglucosamine synthase-like glycosyltransferase/peptidoglycan/xylan/chitin deacetylase (PgdA/CDA1 family)/spore germination protein YaaH